MTVLVAVALVLVMAGITSGRWGRWRRRDDKSIQMHRSRLGVIEHVAGADESQTRALDRNSVHVRIVDGGARRGPIPDPDEEVVPGPLPERRTGRPSFPLPKDRALRPPELPQQQAPSPAQPASARRPVVDHEVAKTIAARVRAARAARAAAAAAEPEPSPTGDRVAAGRWTSLVGAAAAVVLVVAAGAGIGLALKGHSTGGSRPAANVAAGSSSTRGGNPSTPGHPALPSTTTVPTPAVVATSANSGLATYTVNATTLDVSLTTSNPCWVQLRNGTATGTVLYEGTLLSGATQVFHVTGPIWLRLGDPAGIKLAIDGTPVALPATSDPFDVAVTVPSGA